MVFPFSTTRKKGLERFFYHLLYTPLHITQQEIREAIIRTNWISASGEDRIPENILKADPSRAKVLQELFDKVWEAAMVPEAWMKGIIIIFFFKKGDFSHVASGQA